jgi:hypothetical protein
MSGNRRCLMVFGGLVVMAAALWGAPVAEDQAPQPSSSAEAGVGVGALVPAAFYGQLSLGLKMDKPPLALRMNALGTVYSGTFCLVGALDVAGMISRSPKSEVYAFGGPIAIFVPVVGLFVDGGIGTQGPLDPKNASSYFGEIRLVPIPGYSFQTLNLGILVSAGIRFNL